eukprot:Seg2271.4 transcript_id=Seg2271.4/GoldUCD/mRNA.D3Y31 product="hypothetical protein" protein_id=Seg2271.4/GoldUCD/D3Y31
MAVIIIIIIIIIRIFIQDNRAPDRFGLGGELQAFVCYKSDQLSWPPFPIKAAGSRSQKLHLPPTNDRVTHCVKASVLFIVFHWNW